MFKLFIKTSLILSIALFLSVGVDVIYRNSYDLDYHWPQNLWIKPQIKDKYQIVKMGNSHSESGLHLENFKIRSLTLSSVAQSFEYDLSRLKMYSRQIDKDAVVLINVSPLSFSQGKPDKAGSLAYKYYDGGLSPFVIPHLQVGYYLQGHILPFVRSVYLWRTAYAKEQLELAMKSYSKDFPKPEVGKSEPIIIPTSESKVSIGTIAKQTAEEELLSAPFQSDNQISVDLIVNKWRDEGNFGLHNVNTNTKDLEKLIKYCVDHKWRPVLFSIPISQKLINTMGPNFMQDYVYGPLKNTNTRNSEFINYSDYEQFGKNAYLFSNSDHLSGPGAQIYTHFLVEQLVEKGYVTKEQGSYMDN